MNILNETFTKTLEFAEKIEQFFVLTRILFKQLNARVVESVKLCADFYSR